MNQVNVVDIKIILLEVNSIRGVEVSLVVDLGIAGYIRVLHQAE